jgi:hypothetical protein
MINVNLLPPKHVFSQKEREIRKKILLFLAIFSGAFVVIFGSVFGARWYFDSRLAAFDREQKIYQDQLSELSQLGWNVSSIGFKVAGVKYIKKNQHPFSEPIANIRDLTSGLVSVSKVDLSPNYGVEFSGLAQSKTDLERFLTKFTQNDPGTKFLKAVHLKDLQQQENMQFGFAISGEYVPTTTQ